MKRTTSPIKAIRQMCLECNGGDKQMELAFKEIKDCKAVECPLHPFRMGKNVFHSKYVNKA
jgi:hypothetical protein